MASQGPILAPAEALANPDKVLTVASLDNGGGRRQWSLLPRSRRSVVKLTEGPLQCLKSAAKQSGSGDKEMLDHIIGPTHAFQCTFISPACNAESASE